MGFNINKCYELKNLLRIPLKAQINVSKEDLGINIYIYTDTLGRKKIDNKILLVHPCGDCYIYA